jgi:hypothetical protein
MQPRANKRKTKGLSRSHHWTAFSLFRQRFAAMIIIGLFLRDVPECPTKNKHRANE